MLDYGVNLNLSGNDTTTFYPGAVVEYTAMSKDREPLVAPCDVMVVGRSSASVAGILVPRKLVPAGAVVTYTAMSMDRVVEWAPGRPVAQLVPVDVLVGTYGVVPVELVGATFVTAGAVVTVATGVVNSGHGGLIVGGDKIVIAGGLIDPGYTGEIKVSYMSLVTGLCPCVARLLRFANYDSGPEARGAAGFGSTDQIKY